MCIDTCYDIGELSYHGFLLTVSCDVTFPSLGVPSVATWASGHPAVRVSSLFLPEVPLRGHVGPRLPLDVLGVAMWARRR